MSDKTIADRIWEEVKALSAEVEVGGALAVLVREYNSLVEKNSALTQRCLDLNEQIEEANRRYSELANYTSKTAVLTSE